MVSTVLCAVCVLAVRTFSHSLCSDLVLCWGCDTGVQAKSFVCLQMRLVMVLPPAHALAHGPRHKALPNAQVIILHTLSSPALPMKWIAHCFAVLCFALVIACASYTTCGVCSAHSNCQWCGATGACQATTDSCSSSIVPYGGACSSLRM